MKRQRDSSWAGNVVLSLALLAGAGTGSAETVRGRVTLDQRSPAPGLVVRVESPRRTVLTRTDANGSFTVDEFGSEKVLVSVLQDGRLVYRDIVQLQPGNEIAIRLTTVPAARLPAMFDPIAVTVLGDDVFVLSDSGHLDRFRNGEYHSRVPAAFDLNDLAALPNAGVLVGCLSASDLRYAILIAPSTGKLLNRWHLGPQGSQCGGVAADTNQQVFYIGRATDSAILQIDAQSRRSIELVNLSKYLIRNEKIGPMCVETRQQRLFVGVQTRILTVDIKTRRVISFAEGLGEIRGLTVDEERNRLYAADPRRNCVWQFDLTSPEPRAEDFVGMKNVRSAYAIAVDPSGNVWIGDRREGALLMFSPDGALRLRRSRK